MPSSRLGRPVVSNVRRLKTGASGIDWARVADWTALIVADEIAPIAAVFRAASADPPAIRWEPELQAVGAPPLRFPLRHWSSLGGKGLLPHLRQIDALELKPALGHVMLLDPIEGGRDFFYRLYGSTIAQISNLEMTGRLLSEHPASSYVTEFGIASYRAILSRPAPLFTTRKPLQAEVTSPSPRT